MPNAVQDIVDTVFYISVSSESRLKYLSAVVKAIS